MLCFLKGYAEKAPKRMRFYCPRVKMTPQIGDRKRKLRLFPSRRSRRIAWFLGDSLLPPATPEESKKLVSQFALPLPWRRFFGGEGGRTAIQTRDPSGGARGKRLYSMRFRSQIWGVFLIQGHQNRKTPTYGTSKSSSFFRTSHQKQMVLVLFLFLFVKGLFFCIGTFALSFVLVCIGTCPFVSVLGLFVLSFFASVLILILTRLR